MALDIPFADDENFSSIIEVVGAPNEAGQPNLVKALTDYDNDLTVEVADALGQVRVSNSRTGKPLSKAYIKVYGRDSVTGDAVFFKDGYRICAVAFPMATSPQTKDRTRINLQFLLPRNRQGLRLSRSNGVFCYCDSFAFHY